MTLRTPTRPISVTTRAGDRLTERDAEVLRLLAEHQVLTVGQLATALFPDVRKCRSRVAVLRTLGLVETFRPPLQRGSSQAHCVATARTLDLLSADADGSRLRRRSTYDATAIALRPDLGHLRGVNEVFCQLLGYARQTTGAALETWRSERATARALGTRLRPDGFGRWRQGGAWCEFFLEYDTGTEPHARLLAKLTGYTDLAESAGVSCPVLFWLPNAQRESHLHRLLADRPPRVPVATAYGVPSRTHPAGPTWRPSWSPTSQLPLADLGTSAAQHLDLPQSSHILL
ncbi:replication-relaxation family protein [Catenulispora pinisilvae]|uniref:replication-relaxation family protein n=1 Tax=Catenulispora pinisilvae TaxID=2705253 RepID=UPI001891E525|nr:replication-relaxation family protein [Catenulispora pinisilvae]